jgi:hypothetical protein
MKAKPQEMSGLVMKRCVEFSAKYDRLSSDLITKKEDKILRIVVSSFLDQFMHYLR